jgi:hypothetical protein
MKSIMRYILAAVVISLSFTACDNEKEETTEGTVLEGKWSHSERTEYDNNGYAVQAESFTFKGNTFILESSETGVNPYGEPWGYGHKLTGTFTCSESTFTIKVQKFYALQDAGTPINPEAALCQMYGAALKSIGHSLYEDMILDKDGRCVNANMTDYGVPMISEQPDDFKAVLIDVDDPDGPFGAKSISEIACNGAAPAIGNAIHDACGVWVRSWPMTHEKILRELGRIK